MSACAACGQSGTSEKRGESREGGGWGGFDCAVGLGKRESAQCYQLRESKNDQLDDSLDCSCCVCFVLLFFFFRCELEEMCEMSGGCLLQVREQ